MAEVVLEDVGKMYPDGTRAVRDLNLDIADGKLLVLVGPSGCGKTTALRMGGSPSSDWLLRPYLFCSTTVANRYG